MGTGALSKPAGPGLNIGLIAALPAEIGCLTRGSIPLNTPFRINPDLIAIVCGAGSRAATVAAEQLMYQGIHGLVSWGTAGAISSQPRSGDLLLPDSVRSAGGSVFSTDGDWARQIRRIMEPLGISVHGGLLAETNGILFSHSEKKALGEATGAIAADMETAAIMKIAVANHTPCIAVRTVVDQLDDELPPEILKHTDAYGTPDMMNLLAGMLVKPRLIGQCYRLYRAMNAATRTLRLLGDRTNSTLMYAH